MKWSELRPETRRFVHSIALFLVLSAIQPMLWQVVQWQALIVQDKRSASAQTNNVRDRYLQLQQDLNSQYRLLAQLSTIAPVWDDLGKIVERLEQIADKNDLTMRTRSISDQEYIGTEDEELASLAYVVISATVGGTITDVLHFLEAIEHMPELSVVESWSTSPSTFGLSEDDVRQRREVNRLAISRETPLTPFEQNYEMSFDIMFFLQHEPGGS